VTVLIIGILAAGAVPKYADMLHRFRVQAAAERVVADLILAREQAISQSKSINVQFTPASASYTLVSVQHLDSSSQPYAVNLGDEPYHAEIVSAQFPSTSTSVTFDRFGKASADGTVQVRVHGYTKTISLDDQSGKANLL
jgi:Tfp pilus assembly protein FimT